jgi:DNA-binding NarL/FixJ family response regulator
MNNINVSIISVPRISMHACIESIEADPDFHVVARSIRMSGQAPRVALAATDVVIIDESVIEQEGFAALQRLLESSPRVKCLVLMNDYNQDKMIWTLLRGVRGVMCAADAPRLLPKAIRQLHAGEVWMSRGLLGPFRHALRQARQDWIMPGPAGPV